MREFRAARGFRPSVILALKPGLTTGEQRFELGRARPPSNSNSIPSFSKSGLRAMLLPPDRAVVRYPSTSVRVGRHHLLRSPRVCRRRGYKRDLGISPRGQSLPRAPQNHKVTRRRRSHLPRAARPRAQLRRRHGWIPANATCRTTPPASSLDVVKRPTSMPSTRLLLSLREKDRSRSRLDFPDDKSWQKYGVAPGSAA